MTDPSPHETIKYQTDSQGPTAPGPVPKKLRPALIGGIALGVASAIPILNFANCFCCALVIGGGALASWLYLKQIPAGVQPPYGDAAILGLMTGAIGAIAGTIASLPFSLMMGKMGYMDQMREALQSADVPPEVNEMLNSLTGAEMAFPVIFMQMLFSLVIYSIFATIGALIGVAVFHKKAPQA